MKGGRGRGLSPSTTTSPRPNQMGQITQNHLSFGGNPAYAASPKGVPKPTNTIMGKMESTQYINVQNNSNQMNENKGKLYVLSNKI